MFAGLLWWCDMEKLLAGKAGCVDQEWYVHTVWGVVG